MRTLWKSVDAAQAGADGLRGLPFAVLATPGPQAETPAVDGRERPGMIQHLDGHRVVSIGYIYLPELGSEPVQFHSIIRDGKILWTGDHGLTWADTLPLAYRVAQCAR